MATDSAVSRIVFGQKFRPEFTVIAADVEDHDRMIDKATIVLDDPNGVGAKTAALGTEAIVELGWEDESAMLFHGLVESSSICQGSGTGRTEVVLYDDGILMHRQRRDGVRHTGTLSQIVAKIMKDYPTIGTKISPDPDPTFDEQAPLVQSHLTDYEFLNQLAMHYGARSYVEWDAEVQQAVYHFVSNKELFATKPIGSLEYCCGYSKLLEFTSQRVAGRAGTQMVATVMDASSGEPAPTVGPEPTPPPPTQPAPDDPTTGAPAEALAAAAKKEAEQASTPPKPTPLSPRAADKARNDVLAVRDPTRILGWTGNGRAIGTVKLAAKSKVTIKGIVSWAEGDWYVGAAVHSYRRLTSGERSSATYETSFFVTR
jgi:phage protein D